MSFTGLNFVFDGVSSEKYGLILCNFGSTTQKAGQVGSKLSILEDRIPRRHIGVHYGTKDNEAKEFTLVMMVSDDNRCFDRYDIASVAGWLTGHQDYKELTILQPDMEGVFYRCLISGLEQIENGMRTVGFVATVTCDGPHAYRRMAPATIDVSGETTLMYHNHSNVNSYYRPGIAVSCAGTSFSIENASDGSVFCLDGMPDGERMIYIDAANQVMTSSDGINLYQYWNNGINKCFPRFVRGDNHLVISGTGTLTIGNVFPWNIGN